MYIETPKCDFSSETKKGPIDDWPHSAANSHQDEANYGKGKIGGDGAGYEPGGKAK